MEEPITRGFSGRQRAEVTSDIYEEAGRQAPGYAQAAVVTHNIKDMDPGLTSRITTRESDNVEDRRGMDWDRTQPMAVPTYRLGGEDSLSDEALRMRLSGYSRPASEVVSVEEGKFRDYSLPASRLSMAAPKGDLETAPVSEPTAMDPSEITGNRPFYTPSREDISITYKDVWKGAKSMAMDIYDSLAALKDGIPVVEEFNPKDTLNAAGLAMTGGFASAIGREGASLGVAGGRLPPSSGRLPPPPRVREIPLTTQRGEDFMIRQNPQQQSRWEFIYKGESKGGFQITADSVPGQVTIDELVSKAPRGTGLSMPAYAHFREIYGQVGQKLVPSQWLSRESYQNWSKMDPELLARGNYKYDAKDGGYFRQSHDFTHVPDKVPLNPQDYPKQGHLRFDSTPYTREVEEVIKRRAFDPKQDVTAPLPSGVDPSFHYSTKYIPKDALAEIGKKVEAKALEVEQVIKKEIPGIETKLEGTGTSRYILTTMPDGKRIKFRVSDHGSTTLDAISIDPVSGNSIETIRQVLRFEAGLAQEAPQIGWSLNPNNILRDKMRKSRGMETFPQNRQIGGRAQYLGEGKYQIQDQSIGTDIQWRLPDAVE